MGNSDLETKIENLPSSPGVYMMKNKEGRVIYIGKARELKKRVSSYFRDTEKVDPKTRLLIKNIADFDIIVTDTEVEALLTEGTLIKEYRPRYNIDLKDDKNYLCLRIDLRDEFPRFTFIRNIKRDGALYFGPYTNAKALRQNLKWLSSTFLLRQCSDHKFRNRSRPCLYYEINQCSGPCTGLISEEDYRKAVKQVVLFLKGKDEVLLRELSNRMQGHSEEMEYEEASIYRDRIEAIKEMVEVQKVVTTDTKDRDIIGIYREGMSLGVTILFIRGGRLMGSLYQLFKNILDDNQDAVSSFIEQFYRRVDRYIPKEILLPVEMKDDGIVGKWLRSMGSVRLRTPKRGILKDLVTMATKNAESSFIQWKKSKERKDVALEAIARHLKLKDSPRRMECFDISTIQGRASAGSMAVFIDGEPDKGEYRRYRVKGVQGIDDYTMMEEVLKRRIKNLAPENRPDLILIDGGRGHLNMTVSVLRELGHEDIMIASIAKGRNREKNSGVEPDRIFLPGRKNPIIIKGNSSPLFLLMQLRDHAHDFALDYHRRLRKKIGIASGLDDIPGVGEKRKKSLLKHFRRLKDIKEASLEELKEVKGITAPIATQIRKYFDSEVKKSKKSNQED